MEDSTGFAPKPPPPSLHEVCSFALLSNLASVLQAALVYADAGAAESIATTLGPHFLLGLGAAHVCDLEHASPTDVELPLLCGASVSSLVFFTTRLLSDLHPLMLKAACLHPGITTITILSSISEHAHACQASSSLGAEAFAEYEQLLHQDILDMRESTGHPVKGGAGGLRVTVRHLPMLCALDASTFVLPAASDAATLACTNGAAAGWSPPPPQDVNSSEDNPQLSGLSLLAHELAGVVGLLSQEGAGLEVFSLGPTSQLLARELAGLPVPTQGGDSRPTLGASSLGVLLIDRSLDLVTPTSHNPEALVDQLLTSLCKQQSQAERTAAAGLPVGQRSSRGRPRVTWRSTDVRVDVPVLAPLLPLALDTTFAQDQDTKAESRATNQQQPDLLMGCELFTPHDKAAAARLDQLSMKKVKDAATLERKWLKQALSSERLNPSSRTRAGPVTAAELLSLIQDLAGSPGAALRHRSILALASATAAVLGQPGRQSQTTRPSGGGGGVDPSDASASVTPLTRWEALSSLERQLAGILLTGRGGGVMELADTSNALSQALIDALQNAGSEQKALLHPTDVLALLPGLYSLAPDALGDQALLPSLAGGSLSCPLTPGDEKLLRTALLRALQGASTSELQEAYGEHATVEHLPAALDALFDRLHYIAQARAGLQELWRVTVSDMFSDTPGQPAPLLRQIVRRLLQGTELADVQQARSESSLGGMLARNLANRLGGLLGGTSAAYTHHPALTQCDALLVFVVGGLSLTEVREVRQALDEHVPVAGRGTPTVILGGTTLLPTSSEVLRVLQHNR